ncbi:MAG: single-stranded DNA-binding protein [Acidimicrobiia bacterium]
MADNSVTLVGNLVDDPELRFTPSGVALAKLRLAVNRRWRDRNNEWQEETSFFTGTCWQNMAENVAESLQKGARVIVSGRLDQRSWETQEGERRSVVEVRIDEVGPSLRWATAAVTKTPRSAGAGDFAPDSVAADSVAPDSVAPDSVAAAPDSVAAAPVARDDYGPNEAPF